MELNKKNVKAIRGIILFIAVIYLIVIHFETVMFGVSFIFNIVKPFLVGGMLAYVINLPMKAIEKTLFKKAGSKVQQKLKRPVSIVLAILFFVILVYFLLLAVIPQVVATATELGNKIPAFMDRLMVEVNLLLEQYPQIEKTIGDFTLPEINWETLPGIIIDFAQNGVTNMLTSTVTVAGSIVSSIVNLVVSFIFSIYILSQKEKLGDQSERILRAYVKNKVYQKIRQIIGLLNQNFSNFIAGQCTEAIILGLMFAVSMAIFRFPYAIMIGVLITFTALIPIVGAFIGCFIGAFLILVDSPEKVIWFIILFLVLQQIEGNLIYPHVVGSSVGLPSIWVLAAVTIGGSLMGISGMLVFIPLTSTAYTLLRENVNQRNARYQPAKAAEKPKEKPKEVVSEQE